MVQVESMNVIKLNRSQTTARSSQKSTNAGSVQIMLECNTYWYVQVYTGFTTIFLTYIYI